MKFERTIVFISNYSSHSAIIKSTHDACFISSQAFTGKTTRLLQVHNKLE